MKLTIVEQSNIVHELTITTDLVEQIKAQFKERTGHDLSEEMEKYLLFSTNTHKVWIDSTADMTDDEYALHDILWDMVYSEGTLNVNQLHIVCGVEH